MAVPESIRKVARPVNTVVEDSGREGPNRYAVRERTGSKYVSGGNPQPHNGKVIGHIVDGVYVPNRTRDIKVMYIVIRDINEFCKDMHAFSSVEKAKKYYRKILKNEFKKAHTEVDDNGETVDECVEHCQCLLDEHYHYIGSCKYMG